MLNLADFFAMRPHKVEGGRLVKGYAMSGSKESSSVVSALDDQLREQRSKYDSASPEATKKRSATVIRKINEAYLAYMEGQDWLTASQIAHNLDTSSCCAMKVLHRLNAEGKIELKVVRKSGGPGKPLRLWRKV